MFPEIVVLSVARLSGDSIPLSKTDFMTRDGGVTLGLGWAWAGLGLGLGLGWAGLGQGWDGWAWAGLGWLGLGLSWAGLVGQWMLSGCSVYAQ